MIYKTLITFLFSVGLGMFCNAQQVRTLFLGNSYTTSNNLPQITAVIAESMGDDLYVDSNTPGGYTLEGHSTNNTTISKIEEGNWDFVVLQEQSQLPSFPPGQVASESFPFAEDLNEVILEHNPCAETVFYMTWGRENGDAQNCEFWPPVCTYEGMDDLLAENYMTMGEENEAIVSPVGRVWRWIRENHPDLQLYTGDGSHPSALGSYATGLTHYVSMFRNDPELVTYDFSLSDEDAAVIKEAVKLVVYDQLEEWFIGTYDVEASYEVEINWGAGNIDLINTSENATDYIWTVNGEEFTTEDVLYEGFSDTYEVQLVASNGCESVSTGVDLVEFTDNINDLNSESIRVYPNPVMDIVYFNEKISEVEITDKVGKVVYESDESFSKLNLSFLSSGEYILIYLKGEKTESMRIIKE